MNRELPDSSGEQQVSFPSTHSVILLYSLGALIGLVLAFDPSLSALQTTNCLLLSWILALGALGMSVLGDSAKHKEAEPTEIDQDW